MMEKKESGGEGREEREGQRAGPGVLAKYRSTEYSP